MERLHEFGQLRIKQKHLELIAGKSERDQQRAYCNELFRIIEARTTGALSARVVRSGEDNIFDALKQMLTTGLDRSQHGLMTIRDRVVNPRRAKNVRDYEAAVSEWDRDIAKLSGYGGELPNHHGIQAAYFKLLDDNSRAWAIDERARLGIH